jgi:hypothetical protein
MCFYGARYTGYSRAFRLEIEILREGMRCVLGKETEGYSREISRTRPRKCGNYTREPNSDETNREHPPTIPRNVRRCCRYRSHVINIIINFINKHAPLLF